MDRRTFLSASAGGVAGALAGCVTVNSPHERLQWSTSLSVNPGPMDARDIAYADGVVAAVSANTLFGVDQSGAVLWGGLEYPSGVFTTDGGFLCLDWPGYHPRDRVHEAVLRLVSPAGETRWDSRRYVLRDVAVGDGRVFVLHEGDSTVALSADPFAGAAPGWTRPATSSAKYVRLAGDRVVTVGDSVVAYDRDSGDEVWTAASLPAAWPPSVTDDRVYLTSEDPPYRVRVLDATDGYTVAEYEIGSGMRPTAPLAVVEGTGVGAGYAGDANPFFAVDPDTGTVRWWTAPEDEMTVPESPRGASVVVDGVLFLFDYRYVLHAVDLADGSVLWTFDAEKNYPVVTAGEGTVYVLAGARVSALEGSRRS